MFLKNYTSSVPVNQTIHRIETVLIRCGVNGIMKEYVGNTGEIAAITFRVEGPNGKMMTIRLPADEQKALDAMWLDYVDGDKLNSTGDAIVYYASRKRRKKADFVEQARRTAWKIVQDWVEVQMSMIQLRQAEFLQVFLPYIYDGQRTYFQALKESQFAGLLTDAAQK